MKLSIIYTPRAQSALAVEFGGARDAVAYEVDGSLVPVAGDMFSDERGSRRVFVVVSRLLVFDASGLTTVQLLLDLMDASSAASPLRLAKDDGGLPG